MCQLYRGVLKILFGMFGKVGKRRLTPLLFSFYRRTQSNLATPLAIYNSKVKNGEITSDSRQLSAVNKLEALYTSLLVYNEENTQHSLPKQNQEESSWFGGLFGKREATNVVSKAIPRSVYMWGGTGCGKTFVMDMFYDSLPMVRKRRVHFHDFMIDIHKRIHKLKMASNKIKNENNILQEITNEILSESLIICFDEFQVTDIADAMILKVLFQFLFEGGAVLVATSNRPPQDLYKNGLQRDLFVPFIHLLENKADVICFNAFDENNKTDEAVTAQHVDYRLLKFEQHAKNIYFTPINKISQKYFDERYEELSYHTIISHDIRYNITSAIDIIVYGHKFHIPQRVTGRRVARFSFSDLCQKAYGAADYIDLGKAFHIVFISDVPRMDLNNRNELRRFITLIDALYENKVLTIILADGKVMELLTVTEAEKASSQHDEVFAFDRTISRLLEMQSHSYIQESTQLHPQGPDFLKSLPEVKSYIEYHITSGNNNKNKNNNTITWNDTLYERLWDYYCIGSIDELKQSDRDVVFKEVKLDDEVQDNEALDKIDKHKTEKRITTF